MFGNLFNSGTTAIIKKSLDAGMLRSRAISNNIANIDTPGYKRVEVNFESELRKAISSSKLKGTRTDSRHLSLGSSDIKNLQPTAYKPSDGTLPSGVNNVDIDEEMAKLAENQILFNFATKRLQGTYRKLNAAIQAKSIQSQ